MTATPAHCLHVLDERGEINGCAFLLSRKMAVTAAHCVDKLATTGDEIELMDVQTEQIKAGTVCEIDAERDLALIRLSDPQQIALPSGPCRAGDAWKSSYRPSSSEAFIEGTISVCGEVYTLQSGKDIAGVQLLEQGQLGDYSGYSGAPVEIKRGDRTHIAAIVVEQYEDRAAARTASPRATGVVFAAKIDEVYDLHTFAENVHYVVGDSDAGVDRLEAIDRGSEHADNTIRRLRRMANDGLILPGVDIALVETRVAKLLAECFEG